MHLFKSFVLFYLFIYGQHRSVGASQLQGQGFNPELHDPESLCRVVHVCMFFLHVCMVSYGSTPECPVLDWCLIQSVFLVCAVLLGFLQSPMNASFLFSAHTFWCLSSLCVEGWWVMLCCCAKGSGYGLAFNHFHHVVGYWSIFMPPPLTGRGIMFLGCLPVQDSR